MEKLEGGNPTGSYKDKMAVSILTKALAKGEVALGDTVLEFTGGSTGTALAFVSAVLGLKFTAIFSGAFSHSKQQATEAFGMCRRLAREEGIFAGGSTGLNVCAVIDLAVELGPRQRIVTFACDSGAKYLGGPISM